VWGVESKDAFLALGPRFHRGTEANQGQPLPHRGSVGAVAGCQAGAMQEHAQPRHSWKTIPPPKRQQECYPKAC
jgi:hypothetical protein